MYLCDVKSYFELLVLSYSKILSQTFYYMLPKNTKKQTNKTLSHCNAAKMRYFVCFHQTARSTVSDKFGNRATSQTNKTLSHCNAAKMRYFVCFHQTARSTVSDKFGNRATSLGHNRGKFYQSYMK